jgi:hypothetical protein
MTLLRKPACVLYSKVQTYVLFNPTRFHVAIARVANCQVTKDLAYVLEATTMSL